MPEFIKTKVAGVSHNNEDGESRQKLIKKFLNDGDELKLQREPDNEYDRNAVEVYGYREVDLDDNETDFLFKIGYLGGHIAEQVGPAMDGGQLVQASVLEVTGGEEGKSLGVNIIVLIHSPEETAQVIQERIRKQAAEEANQKIQPQSAPMPQKIKPSLPARRKASTKGEWIILVVSIFIAIILFSAAASSTAGVTPAVIRTILIGLVFLVIAGFMAWQIRRTNRRKTD